MAFDLAITPLPLPAPDSSLMSRRLAAGRFILCCAPSYLDKHPAPRRPADLAGHNCLRYAYAPFGDHWPFLDAGGNPMVARVSSNLITTSPETLRAAALAGTGMVLLPSFAISNLLASGGLVPLLPRLPNARVRDCRALSASPARDRQVRAFIDMLAERSVDEQRQLSQASD
jgi:DNA-binding transcriptional LysR family regulator